MQPNIENIFFQVRNSTEIVQSILREASITLETRFWQANFSEKKQLFNRHVIIAMFFILQLNLMFFYN